MATNWLLDDTLSSLKFDRGVQILGHLLAGNADESRIEFESEIGLERDIHLLLRLGIDDTLMVIKLETVVENSLDLCAIFATLRTRVGSLHHLKLDVQIGVRFVRDRN